MNASAKHSLSHSSPRIIKSAGSSAKAAPEVWIPESDQTPTVECDVVDGVVETITVRCGCGCITRLTCETE